MNIIVRMPNWIGDVVMATPVLKDLRTFFPKACITAMAQKNVCELLQSENNIDELFCFSKPKNSFLRREESSAIIEKIRQGNFDVGILLTNSFSSAWWFWQAGVKRRIGYRGHFRRWLLTDSIKPSSTSQHQVIEYKKILAPLGIGVSTTKPFLKMDTREIQEAKELLHQIGMKQTKLIGINPGAAYGSAKCWPKENFRQLAEKILEDTDATIVFFGDSKNANLVREICRGLPSRVIDLSGATSVRQLMSLISLCNLVVTNDSGPMHIASALKVKVLALFGSTDSALTGPYNDEDEVICKKVPCSPCFKRVCPIDFPCMKLISVDEVLKSVKKYV
jgi:heptosyltransferase-2